METPGFKKYNNIFTGFTQIHKLEGFSGLWQGLFPSIMRDAPYTAIWFSSYSQFRILIGYIFGNN